VSSKTHRLVQLLRLTGSEKLELAVILLALPAVAISLKLCGYSQVQEWTRLGSNVVEVDPSSVEIRAHRTARLVRIAATHGPLKTNCLALSLTLAWLLSRQGVATDIRLGARKTANRFEAHAWVEFNGRCLFDADPSPGRFASFGPVETPHTETLQ
jgi:hypothetical protein